MFKTILNFIFKFFGDNLSSIIIKGLEAVKSLFSYKKKVLDSKIDEKKQKKKEEYEKKVDEVVKKGTITDLINLRK